MAFTVVKNLTDISLCESATNWSGSPTAGTTNVREGTNALGVQVSNTTLNLVYSGAEISGGVNLTGQRVFIWASVAGLLDTKANGGIGIIIGDVTNQRAYYVGGRDDLGFQVGIWSCFVLDVSNLPTNFAQVAGAAGPTITAITRVGIRFKTVAKAQGTALNCYFDAVRYGTGLTIYGGSSGSPETFAQIADDDASTATGKAYGIVRRLASGVYGVQGDLTFGDASGTNTSYFKDTDAVVAIEDHVHGSGTPTDIQIKVVGNATGTDRHFELGTAVGSGDTQSGRNGVQFRNTNLTQPVTFDASDTDLKEVLLYGCQFIGFKKTAAGEDVKFSADATNGPNHKLSGCTFDRCGQVDIGRVPTRNTVFQGYGGTAAALLWNANINIKNCKFIANTDPTNNPAGIEHPSATGSPFSYDNLTFTGNDFDVDNSSGSAITVNKTNGSDPSTSTGSAVTFSGSVTVSVTVVDKDNVAIQNAQVAVYKTSDNSEIMNADTNVSGVASTSYSGSTPAAVYWRVRKSSSGGTKYKNISGVGTIAASTGMSITVTLYVDTINSA